MRHGDRLIRAACIMKLRRQIVRETRSMVFLAGMLLAGDLLAADPVALRIESLTVPPATQPLIYVTINNRSESPYQGEITLKPPPQ